MNMDKAVMIAGGWAVEEGTGEIYGGGRRLDLGWWARSTVDRCRVVELGTWNLCHFVKMGHPNKLMEGKK